MHALGTGEMSRASGLSLKALRLYDAGGLLVPAEVDPRTGHRRYAPGQVVRARTIATLRRIDLPLAEIGELLDAPPAEARERLLGWWASQRDDFAARSQAIDRIAASAEGIAPDVFDLDGADSVSRDRIRFESLPDTAIASITRIVDQAGLVPTLVADVIELRRHLEREGAVAGAGHWVIFHSPVGVELPGRIETAVPFTGRAAPTRGIGLRVEAAARYAVVDVAAREVAYPLLLRFYDAVRAAARPGGVDERGGEGAVPTGSPREWYRDAWPDDPGATAVRIAMPVADHRETLAPAPGADPRMSA